MGDWRRYAIYFVPTGALGAFGAAWLGWDIARGKSLPVRPPRIEALTRQARRYGFHATLKAPFRLAPTSSEAALLGDLRDVADRMAPVRLQGGLRLATPGGFPALVPATESPALQQLAALLVRDLDPHRAPLDDAERARRRADSLAPAQRALLERWGYPHVMDEFRFHLTLGARMPASEARAVLSALAPALAPCLGRSVVVDAVSLAGEDEAGRFRQIARLDLRGGAATAAENRAARAPHV